MIQYTALNSQNQNIKIFQECLPLPCEWRAMPDRDVADLELPNLVIHLVIICYERSTIVYRARTSATTRALSLVTTIFQSLDF